MIAGLLVATIHARVHGTDAAVFVQIADEDADGNLSLLQRGMLKASHRRVELQRPWFDGDVMYRPWHPHTEPQLLVPGEEVVAAVEIWPVEFVLRPGHKIVTITSLDGFSVWQPRTEPSVVEILHRPEHPTSLLLAYVPARSSVPSSHAALKSPFGARSRPSGNEVANAGRLPLTGS